MNHSKQIDIQFNRFLFHLYVDYGTIKFEMNSLQQKIIRSYFHVNESNNIAVLIEAPGYNCESQGKLSANYTNFFLDFPIIETILDKTKIKSHIHIELLSSHTNIILNSTSNFRNEYSLNSIQNFTFLNRYLHRSNIQVSVTMLKMMYYRLFSFHSFIQYHQNFRAIQLWNGSIVLPSLFSSKPFLLNYKKDSQLFIQFFNWANLTRVLTNYHISTTFGLQLSIINNLSTKIHIHIEQDFIGRRLSLFIEIARNSIISLTINKKIRYEFISSPIDSLFVLKIIQLDTNETHILPIHYHTDNQTLIRIQIAFSKVFSSFVNDFILDISLKHHSLKLLCYIPLFRREFFSLTWHRYVQKDLFHFHGLIQMKILQRKRFFDYKYNWSCASFRLWKLSSRLIILSLDSIQFNLNLTNDYLWYGKWAIDFRLMLSNRRQLIKLNHRYHYTTYGSKFSFDLYLVNSHYDLDFNYYNSNYSIQGQFIKNKNKHKIFGYWNRTSNVLHLNIEQIKSITIITPTFIKSIVNVYKEQIGVLIERTTSHFTDDTRIVKVDKYRLESRLC